jgi:sRNA-binding carbon storage regulator CsrA
VLEARHGKVKLGFAGPPEVPIHREEILRRNRPETEERLQQVGV